MIGSSPFHAVAMTSQCREGAVRVKGITLPAMPVNGEFVLGQHGAFDRFLAFCSTAAFAAKLSAMLVVPFVWAELLIGEYVPERLGIRDESRRAVREGEGHRLKVPKIRKGVPDKTFPGYVENGTSPEWSSGRFASVQESNCWRCS